MDSLKLIKKLTSFTSVSGDEQSSFESLKELFSRYGDVTVDNLHNILIHKSGKGRKILLDAHMDTIGFVVTEIKDGFLRLSKVGGIDFRVVEGAPLIVHGKDELNAFVCTVPPHLSEEEKVSEDGTVTADTGLSQETLQELVCLGDKASFAPSFSQMSGDMISSPYLDDRAGVAVLLNAMEMQKSDCDITLMLSAQEETGGSGSAVGSYHETYDLAVAVDVSFAMGPGCKEHECGVIHKGPMIGFSPILSREYSEKLVNIASRDYIPYQREIMNGRTGTNADEIVISRDGIPSALVSIPIRNMHTPVECCALSDLDNCSKLIAKFIEEV